MKKFLSLLLALVLLVSSVPVQMAHATEAEEVYLEPAAATEETEAATEETTEVTEELPEEVTEETTAATEEVTEETTAATEETTAATEETTEPTEEVTEETTEVTEETTEATEETTEPTEEVTEETTEATEETTEATEETTAATEDTTEATEETTEATEPETDPAPDPAADFQYRVQSILNADGRRSYIVITGYTGTATDIVIPSRIEELPVEVIASRAFLKNSNLKYVTIPETVRTIGENAFFGCSALKEIIIPDSVTKLEGQAFAECKSAKVLVIGTGVEEIGDYAFRNCNSLVNVYIPDNVKRIQEGVFQECLKLETVAWSGSSVTIYSMTFDGCSNLRCVAVPKSVKYIYDAAFDRCPKLHCMVYEGTKKQLGKIQVDVSGNDALFDVGWHLEGSCCQTSITVTQDKKTGKPKISWKEKPCILAYGIYRATSEKGEYKYIDVTYDYSYTDLSASSNKKYYYIVVGISDFWVAGSSSKAKSITTGCAAPALSITNSSGGYPKISWKKVSGAKKYEVYYSTSENGTYTKLTTTTSTSYTHSKAAFGKTYYYKVKTIGSSSSLNSALSGAVMGSRMLGKPDVTASFNATTGFADLKWEKISGATGYEIDYKVGSGEYQRLTTTTSTSYTHQDVEIGKTYTYIVRAVSSAGKPSSVYSSADSVKIEYAKPTVKSSRDPATGKTILSWEAVRGAAQYQVYYATSKSGSYKKLATTENLTVTHTGATAGKTYYYKVRLLDAEGNKGPYSSVKSVLCDYPKPVITTAESNSSGYPYIKWKKVSGAKKYEVYCATSEDGTYKKLTTTTSTSYTYKDASPGKGYYFKVRCYGSSTSSRSSYSEIVFAARKLSKASVTVELNSTARSAKVTWKKVTGATAYEVQCKVADGSYETLTTTTSRSFTHTGLEVGVDYTYRVKAMSKVEEAYRNSSGKTVHIKCAKPVVTLSLDETSGKPSLAWEAVEGAAKYQIYYATSKDGKYKKLAEVTEPGFIHEAASAGKTYYYKVRALDAAGEKGSYCSILKIKSK